MNFAPDELYPITSRCIWVHFDTEDAAQCARFHELRDGHQGRSDVEAVNERFYVLRLFPGWAPKLDV